MRLPLATTSESLLNTLGLSLSASTSLAASIVAIAIAGVGVPIPESPFLLGAGVLTQRASLSVWWVGSLVLAVAVAGDVVLFLLARRYGEALLQTRLLRSVATESRRERLAGLFERKGSQAVWIGRQVAGLRTLVVVIAGIERMPLRTFVAWDAFGSLLSVPPIYVLGYLFSTQLDMIEGVVSRFQSVITIVVIAVAVTWWTYSRRRQRVRTTRL